MEWSAEDAMKAYLHTLQLDKIHSNQDCTKPIEPKSMEFISALAAGKKVKLIIEITSEGISPLTLALAVAANQTGGRLICILPKNLEQEKHTKIITDNQNLDFLENVIEFVHGNPCDMIKQYKNVDFAVVDCEFEEHSRVLKNINVNPRGCVVVVRNLGRRKDGLSVGESVKKRRGVRFVTLPIGEGMEMTRIGGESRRVKRFHVTYEN